MFALDVNKLKAPDITFWSVWEEGNLIGCGALKELSLSQGEIKSMRTPAATRNRGAGRAMLEHIIVVAKQRGYTRLHLETGTHAAFETAHNLYRSKGFTLSGPFGSYHPDPHSVFMEFRLGGSEA